MKRPTLSTRLTKRLILVSSLLYAATAILAQSYQSLETLSDFRNPSANWQIVGETWGTPTGKTLSSKAGKGIFLCEPKKGLFQAGDNLISTMEHGDLELSLDFMLPKGSNSGIYLQGRYEIQIFDSWGVTRPLHSDAGGIYQRWDESRLKGNEGFEGHPPRANAIKAPGLWNHLDISFKAPRFDASGKKISPARFAKVSLNGVVIHQNVDLFGPTRAAAFETEKPMGPLMLQGDHGIVAYKNIRVTRFGNNTIRLTTPVKYQIYEQAFTREQKGAILDKPKIKDLSTLKPVLTGETSLIDATVSRRGTQYYVFTGKFTVPSDDIYDFKGNWHGYANVWIDDELVLSDADHPWYGLGFNEETLGKKQLSAGEHHFKIGYTHRDWETQNRALALFVRKKNEAWQALHDKRSEMTFSETVLNDIQPTTEPVFQRSFVLFGGKKRTHAINVGFPQGVHYSYDLKQGALLYAWRGLFLNTTDMWHERGEEQTAQPLGVAIPLTGRFALWTNKSFELVPEPNLRYEGMTLIDIDKHKTPQYIYRYQNGVIKDLIQPNASQSGLLRTLSIVPVPTSFETVVVLATATKGITQINNSLYAIDDSHYYIQLPMGISAQIRTESGQQFLVADLKTAVFSYEILF